MLDHTFYQAVKVIYAAGPDWAVISVFVLIILIALYCVLASKVNRLLHAGIAVFVCLLVTYMPCVWFPQILEGIYLKLGLITPWYLETVPKIIVFPTLWLPAILVPIALWTVCVMVADTLGGKPLLTKKIIARNHENALDINRQMVEQWRLEKQERERLKEDPAGLH
ncbi:MULTISPECIES: hypothetical protein [unclassified Paenibacillus]|uniref:hypothetical protein n=1 Tax=unclassified Paenibacillus TaxID=185978 RepID=UPI00278AF5B9|nr:MULTISPECIES: hypothetical protein [unclassified Paenibacillus]MDQ0896346.1 hypothetical protein [Paenibacillus sp. V4I7]MDQ0914111.1 hypothetical protein [Paenibacillus sp. V4I5]